MRGPRAADAVAAVRDRRRAGWSDEIAFWDHWLAMRGFNWPEDYRRKTDPKARIQIPHRLLPREATRLLVGTRLPGVEVELVPVDPLADEYDALLDRHGVSPPVRTRPCPRERGGRARRGAVRPRLLPERARSHGGAARRAGANGPCGQAGPIGAAQARDRRGRARGLRRPARLELQDRGRQIRDLECETRIYPDERLPLAAGVEPELVDEEGYTWVRVGIRRRAD